MPRGPRWIQGQGVKAAPKERRRAIKTKFGGLLVGLNDQELILKVMPPLATSLCDAGECPLLGTQSKVMSVAPGAANIGS
jgi:hypothetical protein